MYKKKTFQIITTAWLILLSIIVYKQNENIRWLQGLYDNVIEVLITR